jgi:hypothetical protein
MKEAGGEPNLASEYRNEIDILSPRSADDTILQSAAWLCNSGWIIAYKATVKVCLINNKSGNWRMYEWRTF